MIGSTPAKASRSEIPIQQASIILIQYYAHVQWDIWIIMDYSPTKSSRFLWVCYWGHFEGLLVVSIEGFDFASLSPAPDFVLEPAHVIKAGCFKIECFVDSSCRAKTSTTLQFGTVFASSFLIGFGWIWTFWILE